jgi:hypothetical protein
MLLLLPLRKLINVYLHAAAVLLFGLAHFVSIKYIEEEIKSGLEFVVLDDFIKLEKHGYTFIAQVSFWRPLYIVLYEIECLDDDKCCNMFFGWG